MIYKDLGNSGLKISVIGMGCWPIAGQGWTGTNEKESLAALDAAIDGGITLIDTAYMYGRNGESERLVGKAIRQRRGEIILATKCGIYWEGNNLIRDSSKERINKQIEESLLRLDTDYIDLYQIHAPDDNTPLVETAATLYKLKEQGKIRAIGVSNYDLNQITTFSQHTPLDSIQPPYNPLIREIENDILPFCQNNKISVISYWPLYKGLLTGKYRHGHQFPEGDSRNEDNRFKGEAMNQTLEILDRLRPIGEEYGKSVAQLIIHWTSRQQGITSVLCGATRVKQVEDNIEAVGWTISEDHCCLIDKIVADLYV